MRMQPFVNCWYFDPHPEKNRLRPITESLIGLVDTPAGAKRKRWLSKMYAFGREGHCDATHGVSPALPLNAQTP